MAKAWQPLLAEEKQKEYFVQLMQRVEQARETEVIFPPESEVFNALKLTAPE
ncbi:MAG TPA: uracil-DNA glycosylase, partial [Idiomarina baltica]|nr:uracil-DNA glycosylase [Idiomarina baltica]